MLTGKFCFLEPHEQRMVLFRLLSAQMIRRAEVLFHLVGLLESNRINMQTFQRALNTPSEIKDLLHGIGRRNKKFRGVLGVQLPENARATIPSASKIPYLQKKIIHAMFHLADYTTELYKQMGMFFFLLLKPSFYC